MTSKKEFITINDESSRFILNPENKRINRAYIQQILKNYSVDYEIRDLGLFQTAMIHSSYVRGRTFLKPQAMPVVYDYPQVMPLQDRPYEILEYLGDSVIHLVLADYFIQRYPDAGEGFMTKLRTKLEQEQSLVRLALTVGLNEYMVISKILEDLGTRQGKVNIKILEDIFEAFIGALFTDGGGSSGYGYSVCRNFLVNFFEKEIDFATLIYNEDNYKDILLRMFDHNKKSHPVYEEVNKFTENNKNRFEIAVIYIDENDNAFIIGRGIGGKKTSASQKAAKEALDNQLEYHNSCKKNALEYDELELIADPNMPFDNIQTIDVFSSMERSYDPNIGLCDEVLYRTRFYYNETHSSILKQLGDRRKKKKQLLDTQKDDNYFNSKDKGNSGNRNNYFNQPANSHNSNDNDSSYSTSPGHGSSPGNNANSSNNINSRYSNNYDNDAVNRNHNNIIPCHYDENNNSVGHRNYNNIIPSQYDHRDSGNGNGNANSNGNGNGNVNVNGNRNHNNNNHNNRSAKPASYDVVPLKKITSKANRNTIYAKTTKTGVPPKDESLVISSKAETKDNIEHYNQVHMSSTPLRDTAPRSIKKSKNI